MTLLFDIEADGLPDFVTKIWCIVIKDVETGIITDYSDENGIKDAINRLQSANAVVAHNAITYDIPVIKKLYGVDLLSKAHDTMILSQMLYPNQMQSHSIESWGKILGKQKFKAFKDEKWWLTGNLNELLPRCRGDVDILSSVWARFTKNLNSGEWNTAIKLEYACQHYVYQHNVEGYPFDIKLATRLVKLLEYLQGRISRKIKRMAQQFVEPIGNSVSPFRKDRSLTKQAQLYVDKHNMDLTTIHGDFTRIDYHEINLSSTQQKVKWLLNLGWKPESYTEKDSPSLIGSEFIGVPEDVSEDLKRHNIMKHRSSVLQGWIESQKDGIIHGGAYTCGTNTGRFRHKGVVNVPRAEEGKYLGKHMRALFNTHEGYDMVGFDFKALEARVEGHYTYFIDGGEYANWLLTCEDIHAFHADLWSVPRSEAKVYGYALSYQCGPKKIEFYGKSPQEAKYIYDRYWEARPAVKKLIKQLEAALIGRNMARKEEGRLVLDLQMNPWIKGIDGRHLFVRSMHSIKNTLIQSAGALLVKHTYVKICRELYIRGIPMEDIRVPIVYHDECQAYVKQDKAIRDEYFSICHKAIDEVNKEFKLNVPLEIDIKVGRNWAETH